MDLTDRIVGLLTMRNPIKRAVRAAVIPVATSLPAVQRRAAGLLSQVSLAYPAGQFVAPGSELDGLAPRGGPRPGERAPDISVRTPDGPSRLYVQLRAGSHILVASSTDEVAALDSAGITGDGLVRTVIGRIGDCAVTLVRPDGVLAARGGAGVADYLHGLRLATIATTHR
jgi:hypothetical protein